MIPHHIPYGDVGEYQSLWYWVSEVFEHVGFWLFARAWLAELMIFMLAVAGARFVWRVVRGVL